MSRPVAHISHRAQPAKARYEMFAVLGGSSLIAWPGHVRENAGVEVMAVLVEHGMLLQSARGPLPNVAELVAGEHITGSWWGHPAGHQIFNTLAELNDSTDVVRLRLVNGKVTLVHRRLWPALVCVADHFTPHQLAALREEHTSTGAHRVVEHRFPDWVPADVVLAGEAMSVAEALAELPHCLRT